MNTGSLSLFPDYQAMPLTPAAAASSLQSVSQGKPSPPYLSFLQGFRPRNEENPQGTFFTSSCGARSPPWYNYDNRNRSL